MSQEIVKYNPMAEYMPYVAQLEPTLIFNRHATREDAERSVSYVQPDSIVFVEGYSLKNSLSNPIDNTCQSRLVYGKNSPEYMQDKKDALRICETVSLRPAMGMYDPQHYEARLIAELLEKDCVIVWADYMGFGAEDAESLRIKDFFVANAHRAAISPVRPENVKPSGIGLAMKLDREICDAVKFHALREDAAVQMIAVMTKYLLTNRHLNSEIETMRNSVTGKFPASIIYGTAHRYSLAASLSGVGLQDVPIMEPRPAAPEQYLDTDLTAYSENRRRRLAMKLFDLTHIIGSAKGGERRTLRDEVYRKFEAFNHQELGVENDFTVFSLMALDLIRRLHKGDGDDVTFGKVRGQLGRFIDNLA